jgi:flagellin-specific chaperone FliS
MSIPYARAELLRQFGPLVQPKCEASLQQILEMLFEGASLETKRWFIIRALEVEQLATARNDVRRVLVDRGLIPSTDDEARIASCSDVKTLYRWLRQAICAASVSEALA